MLPLSPEPDDCSDREDEDVKIETFPREQLHIIEKLGEGKYGDVHLCEVHLVSSPERDTASGLSDFKLVVVYSLSEGRDREEFIKEIRALSKLKDPNIAHLLGACLDVEPICAVREYAQMGDLCQFLQEHIAETATPLTSTANTLR